MRQKRRLVVVLAALIVVVFTGWVLYKVLSVKDNEPLNTINYWEDSGPALPKGTVVDSLVVYKSKRHLLAYTNGKVVKTYCISLGQHPIGAKEYEGDSKTPEGIYKIDGKNPNSKYHKNLGISYPSARDIAHAKKLGKSPGGEVKIHGMKEEWALPKKLEPIDDWTAGCMALTNPEIDELFEAVAVGTKVNILP